MPEWSRKAGVSESPSELSADPSSRAPWFLITLVLVLTFAAYAGTLLFHFVYDDRGQVLENPFIRSWHYIPIYFTRQIWTFASPRILGNYYRPVFLLWFMMNHSLFGLSPMGWHLTTVLAHLVVTSMVYWLALKLSRDYWVAVVGALIFGLHPAHIESVAWVSGVTDPLLALCLIPAFVFYLNARQHPHHRTRWFAASLFFYGLALLAKETGVILPPLIFAYEWIWDPEQSRVNSPSLARVGSGIKRIVPYIVLTGVYLVARTWFLRGLAHVMNPLPFSTVILTWPSLLWFYFKHLAWPFGLSVFYNRPYVSRLDAPHFLLPLGGLVLVGLGLRAWRNKIRGSSPEMARLIEFSAVCLLAPFMPLADLSLLAKGEIAHDRYLYLPLVGFSILLALAIRHLPRTAVRIFGEPAPRIVALLFLAAFLGTATASQDLYWANDFLLYSHGVARVPTNNIAMTDLASVYGELGQYGHAITLYQTVLSRDPNHWPAIYNLGYTYYQLGELPEAEYYLKRAVTTDTSQGSPDEFFYLGMTLMKEGRMKPAAAEFRRAIVIRPDGLAYHLALGLSLKQLGDLPGALREFKQEEKNHPQEVAARQQAALIEKGN